MKTQKQINQENGNFDGGLDEETLKVMGLTSTREKLEQEAQAAKAERDKIGAKASNMSDGSDNAGIKQKQTSELSEAERGSAYKEQMGNKDKLGRRDILGGRDYLGGGILGG